MEGLAMRACKISGLSIVSKILVYKQESCSSDRNAMKEKKTKMDREQRRIVQKIKQLGNTLGIRTKDLSLRQNEMDSTFTTMRSE